MNQMLVVDEVRHAGEHGRAEERVRDSGDRGEQDDLERRVHEHQCDEDGEPHQVGRHHEGFSREPVDQRPRCETDDH